MRILPGAETAGEGRVLIGNGSREDVAPVFLGTGDIADVRRDHSPSFLSSLPGSFGKANASVAVSATSPDRRAEIKAISASVLVHAAVFASFFLSVGWKAPEVPETRTLKTFSVSLQGEGTTPAIPKVGAPVPDETAEKPPETKAPSTEPDKVVEPPKPEVSDQPVGASAVDQGADLVESSEGGMIWTPPAPTPNASTIAGAKPGAERPRVVMPEVALAKGASDPVLLSYDQGRFSDATTSKEAGRLSNAGTITMSVTVDDKGAVGVCSVTSTSGSPTLDDKACALIRSYTYRPAQDAFGKPHGAIVFEVLEWAKDGKFTSPAADSAAAAAERRMPVVSMPGPK